MKITIAGTGTAGLISALLLRSAFPRLDITLISSSKIGIIGVGEGSTEHWRFFMSSCSIPVVELLNETKGTHKAGIRFENWTRHTPDYFHSISTSDTHGAFNIHGLYNGLIRDGKGITENSGSRAIIENKVRAEKPHESVNQFHFDTFKLNQYLTNLAKNRNIAFIDKTIKNVNLNNENGYIESVTFDDESNHISEFWLDATGMSRVLISKVSDAKWNSFSKYLQMNTAIPFPTPSDPSGEIRPYTRARAIANGWVWEIPTQERRGNGYVYSSHHCSDDQAIKEVSELLGFDVEPVKKISFDPGFLPEMWSKNCVAIGLSSAFVEPIEATSIGGTIQQVRCLIQNLPGYKNGSDTVQKIFNKKMSIMMDNILAMIYLHYISDRRDSEMWRSQANIPVPEYLQNLIEIWNARPPSIEDIAGNNYEMFLVPHFYHVGQGQKIFKRENSDRLIKMFSIEDEVRNAMFSAKLGQTDHVRIDHGESLRQIQI